MRLGVRLLVAAGTGAGDGVRLYEAAGQAVGSGFSRVFAKRVRFRFRRVGFSTIVQIHINSIHSHMKLIPFAREKRGIVTLSSSGDVAKLGQRQTWIFLGQRKKSQWKRGVPLESLHRGLRFDHPIDTCGWREVVCALSERRGDSHGFRGEEKRINCWEMNEELFSM